MVMNPYIRHSAKGTTWSKDDHKYIKKIKVNGKWRYFYGSDETDATLTEADNIHAYEDAYGNQVLDMNAERHDMEPGATSYASTATTAKSIATDQAPAITALTYDRSHSPSVKAGFQWTGLHGNYGFNVYSFKTAINSGVTYVNSLPKNTQKALYLGVTNSALGPKRKDRGH